MLDHRAWALATAGVFIVMSIWAVIQYVAERKPTALFLICMVLGLGLVTSTAWRGGELVYRHGLGVMSLPDTGAHEHAAGVAHDHGAAAPDDHHADDGMTADDGHHDEGAATDDHHHDESTATGDHHNDVSATEMDHHGETVGSGAIGEDPADEPGAMAAHPDDGHAH
jgi:hypothetical protein